MNSIEVKKVKKTFNLKKSQSLSSVVQEGFLQVDKLVALDNVSFTISKGEMIGVIGSNGSGKTTLLRIIGGIYQPDSGNITIRGKMAPLLQIGTGFHDELIAKENIMMYGMLLGLNKETIIKKIDKIISFAELEGFENMKLRNYSTGMKSRLGFSTALEVNPDILLVDEILAVGDISFRKKSFDEFMKFKQKEKTILYTTHNINILPQLCDRVILLNKGKMEMIGKPDETIQRYREIIAYSKEK
jgi:ABC-type polysaccharide/polyol phosphate transport system ATPase subunit